MISEHGDALIADFREYYSVRLLDVLKFDGSLNVAEAAILARKLPPSSRTVAAVQGGDEYWGWDFERHVLVSIRSEEHTSELQSRENLVCRLLLEKKNDVMNTGRPTGRAA